MKRAILIALFASLIAFGAHDAWAQAAPAGNPTLNIDLGTGDGLTARVLQLAALITVLSLLRTAIGLQQAPPNVVIVSLSLFLTAFVMEPVWNQAYTNGIGPVMRNEMQLDEAFPRVVEPLKRFMGAQTRDQDLLLFMDMAHLNPRPTSVVDTPLRVLAPAFMVSELRRSFEIGFMLFIPFLIIDLVVSSLLMAMGMMMMPPVTVSLPFKLIFFVLVDGWRLVAGSLIQSFAASLPPPH